MKSVEAEECYYDVTNYITFFAGFLRALKSMGSLNIAANSYCDCRKLILILGPTGGISIRQ